MQVTPRFSPAGVLASAFTLAAIVSPIAAGANSRRALALHGNPTNGSLAILATPAAHKPTGVAFGSAGSHQAETDRLPLLKFTIDGIGPIRPDGSPIAAEGMAFDHAGNFFVAHFSAKTVVMFDSAGPVLVGDPREFGPPPAFLAIRIEDSAESNGQRGSTPPVPSVGIGPIPEPGGIGVLTGIALLGIGVGLRLRRQDAGAAMRVAARV